MGKLTEAGFDLLKGLKKPLRRQVIFPLSNRDNMERENSPPVASLKRCGDFHVFAENCSDFFHEFSLYLTLLNALASDHLFVQEMVGPLCTTPICLVSCIFFMIITNFEETSWLKGQLHDILVVSRRFEDKE